MSPRSRLLVVNPGARAAGEEVLERLRRELPEYEVLGFPPSPDLALGIAPESVVVAVGGDGTVGAVARLLAGTRHALGIVPAGTFNNFASSLGLPGDFEAALEVIRQGRARPVSVGRVAGRIFLEAAAAGFFGEGMAAGEDLKELQLGSAAARLGRLASARPFRYRLSGDLEAAGRAHSVIAANTSSTGSRIPIASADPEDPYLELAIVARGGRLARLLGMLLRRPALEPGRRRFRRLRLETDEPVPVVADAEEAGTTPVEIEILPGGLRVILPA